MTRPLFIFDLDGTLALTDHRQHLVRCENPNWPAFFAACKDDLPFVAVIRTLHLLLAAGAEVWIWSGRSDEVRAETETWLWNCGVRVHQVPLRMRRAGDHRRDEVVKAEWMDEVSEDDRLRLVAIFDDRDRVVAMWRDRGVPCFQVAPGAF